MQKHLLKHTWEISMPYSYEQDTGSHMHVKASWPAAPVQEPHYTAVETNKDLETSSPSVNKWIILALDGIIENPQNDRSRQRGPGALASLPQ
ncbi:hypothetical protein KSD_94600 [Ktedonobacter sp. SOSP1-85]|nr:hypothetical protein KSD_94600 [Ktedonobacter sp. SOSP1-85]